MHPWTFEINRRKLLCKCSLVINPPEDSTRITNSVGQIKSTRNIPNYVYCRGKQKYRKSYQHGCYSDIPLCPYTLPEIYDLAAMTHPESLIKFVRPETVISHGDLYKKVKSI